MDAPNFSVIIPTYNRNRELLECLEGLSGQLTDKRCLEVIIANDGGDKHSIEKLNIVSGRTPLRYLHLEHKGPAATRNAAVAEAKGDIILFLDDDCIPAENWMEETIKTWERFPEVSGVGGCVAYSSTDSIYCKVNSDIFNWYLDQHSSGEYCKFISTYNAGYKKGIFNKVKGFDEQFRNASGEDRDLNIKILEAGGKLKLNKNIFVYHDRSLSFKKFVRRYYHYGRAAYMLHVKHPDLKRTGGRGYKYFFVTILNNYKGIKEKYMVFYLLTVSQLATVIGYFLGML